MADISIKVIIRVVEVIYEIPSLIGEIQVGSFKETFVMPLEYWSLEDYKKQWREGLARIKDHDTSCLVTVVQDPKKAPLIELWALYKINNKIHVQNELYVDVHYDAIVGESIFTPENCYDFITPRETHTASGNKISEWIVDFNEA